MNTETVTNTEPAPAAESQRAGLTRLAALTPLCDGELLAIACGWTPAKTQSAIDLATALYHERHGMHNTGECITCDLARMNELAITITARNWGGHQA